MQDRPHREHAQRLVEQFRKDVGPELEKAIGDFHFGSLVMLVESALNTSVMMAMNETIGELEEVVNKARARARH